MNTNEILDYFAVISKCRPTAQYTVVPSDKLKNVKINSYPFFLCANLDESNMGGSHWVGMYIERKGAELEFFDSYGIDMYNYTHHFSHFVNMHDLRVIQNKTTLQGQHSLVCGHYVIMYMYFRLRGCSPQTFYARFSNNVERNDRLVYNFVNKISVKRISCKNFQICKALK